ncbi:MAG: hypothetical protein SCARUB_00077 [Candidatus Scalindua rubra]|uniref:DUF2442 domain-containing protein n=1 Tax=Candidatus Scalindua rubra TaxID=1872076 RepID=A0A1E3XGQ7_9BACT|nr:MAG: hypothetical protein SCARUB_00077 [Candidatus Scalindua rubra]
MFLHVEDAKYLRDYVIWIRFNDGTEGEIDLSYELEGPVFEPLNNIEFFKKFKIHCNTLSWENGADFAPEFLKELLSQPVTPSNPKHK